MISMKILFHVWNLIFLRDKNIIKVPWLILFLYNKTSVQNSFPECPIVFVCDLWPVTCDLHFSRADSYSSLILMHPHLNHLFMCGSVVGKRNA